MRAGVVISDLHIGSYMGLCPERATLALGAKYTPNKYQATLTDYWDHFWGKVIPKLTKKAKRIDLFINGDLIDGVHHDSTAIISNSWGTQEDIAFQVLDPIRGKVDALYVIRGTEAHGGPMCESEEKIATRLGAEKTDLGEYSSYQWWVEVEGVPMNFAHHIGVTSSTAYESSAPMRELVTTLVEAAQWDQPIPQVVWRSHRHRFIEVPLPTSWGRIRCIITPAWQLRSPHTERIDRMRMPHIGGVIFTVEDGICNIHEKIYPLPGPAIRKI